MIRVLQVYPSMNNAGTEMVIMNWYRNIDRNKIQFDFLVQNKGSLDEDILNMGGKIHYISNDNNKLYKKKLVKFFRENKEYNIIHTHTHSEMGRVLNAAKIAGINCRVAHSHNCRSDANNLMKILKKIKSIPIKNNATHFFACSKEAGEWLFPFKNIDIEVIKNGIDLEKFKYNSNFRNEIRKELGIKEDEKVICHVGRFAEQKNHKLVVDICNEVIKTDKKIKVILVGNGPLEESIKEKVKDLDLSYNFIFLGNRTDVNKIMSAADLFLFPSLYEGLGIVLIEAQANGLTCIVSNGVPDEADMNIGLYNKLSIEDDILKWSQHIKHILYNSINRDVDLNIVRNMGYDIKKISKNMYNWYTNKSFNSK